jgi:hypothetical protein
MHSWQACIKSLLWVTNCLRAEAGTKEEPQLLLVINSEEILSAFDLICLSFGIITQYLKWRLPSSIFFKKKRILIFLPNVLHGCDKIFRILRTILALLFLPWQKEISHCISRVKQISFPHTFPTPFQQRNRKAKFLCHLLYHSIEEKLSWSQIL